MYVLRESILHKLNNVRSWHKADDRTQTQTSMTYLLRKLCPSLANNQTVCLEAARVKTWRTLNRYISDAP